MGATATPFLGGSALRIRLRSFGSGGLLAWHRSLLRGRSILTLLRWGRAVGPFRARSALLALPSRALSPVVAAPVVALAAASLGSRRAGLGRGGQFLL